MRAVVLLGLLPALAAADERPLDQQKATVAATRHVLSSTALTVPAHRVEGSLAITRPGAVLLAINGGVTRSTELWVDAGVGLGASGSDDHAYTYGVGVKQIVVKNGFAALAMTAGIRRVSVGIAESRGYEPVGAVGTACVGQACALEVSLGYQYWFSYRRGSPDGNYSSGAHVVTLGGSFGSRTLRGLVEATEVNEVGDQRIGLLGVRYATGPLAFDLAVGGTWSSDAGSRLLPWLAVTGQL